ncbi:exonuclease SbcCD subunit D, partial [Pediococcus acidilactici]|uniref:metallophosphoesterase family protein n=1 Tax=Pediococcus acidilactici TaxID=1254 RepID=UPI003A90A4ED
IEGDLYDRSVPAADAVALYNELMVDWNLKERIPIFAISGNHDSSTRLSAGTPWFSYSNYFLRTQLAEAFEPVEFNNIQFFF